MTYADDVLACDSIVAKLREGNLRGARREMLVTPGPRYRNRSTADVAHLALEVAATMIRNGGHVNESILAVQAALRPDPEAPR